MENATLTPSQERNPASFSLCCYYNRTPSLLVACWQGTPHQKNEKVLFPGECFLFEAPLETYLEIHQPTPTGIIREAIACQQLQVAGANPPAIEIRSPD